MSGKVPPMGFNSVSSATSLASDLGNTYEGKDGKFYRLVKAAADIASAAEKILVSAASSGTLTWSCNTTTTANNYLAVGVVPASIDAATTTSGTIDSGEYFFVQVAGVGSVTSAAAIAAGGLVGTSTTAGKADDATVAAGVGSIGVALESAAGADESVGILIKGLL